MSDENALLAAIWEHPHDDTVRLVYAHWLQENGQSERAEFIRVQIESAKLGYWDDSPRKSTLLRAEERLKKAFGATWRSEVPGSSRQETLSRGFVLPTRRFSTTAFLRLRAGDFDAAPQWEVTVVNVSRASQSVLNSSLLARAVKLDLRMGKAPPGELFEWLGEATHARHLRTLGVTGLPILPSRLDLFLHSAVAEPLEGLWLNYFHDGPYRLDGQVLRMIATTPIAGNLRALGLALNPDRPFSDGAFPWREFPRLECLSLDYSGLGDEGLRRLLAGDVPTTLRRLDLQYNGLTDAGARVLAAWPGGQAIRQLVIVSNAISEQGVQFLRDSPYFRDLQYLSWRW